MALLFQFLLLAICSSASVVLNDRHLVGSRFGVPGINATYDYVVVGGGTAGLTLATRLAQNGSFSVAVIEAGSFAELDNGNLSQVPYSCYNSADVAPDLSTVNGLIDWRFLTTPQAGLMNRTAHYTRGKCLGGSSARNYMVYQRGTAGTFDKWAEEVGDPSYSWTNVFPYFKKSTAYSPPNTAVRLSNRTAGSVNEIQAYSPPGGPLHVSLPNFASPLSSYFPPALEDLGLHELSNGASDGDLNGYASITLSEDPKFETRSSSETSFLRLALETTSLTVYTHALAKRIVFDENRTARRVLVDVDGMTFSLNATKEVIVSAGALQSPQLLMVSGIGPQSTLQKYDIPVIADRPGVGENMWDNPIQYIYYSVNVETASTLTNQPKRYTEELEKYTRDQTGMLTTTGVDLMAFLKLTDHSSANISSATRNDLSQLFPSDYPEIEVVPFSNGPTGLAHDTAAIATGLLTTFSRGSVTINSSDMADAPIIDPRWLEDKRDQELFIAAFRFARLLASSASVQEVIIGDELIPGLRVQTDEQILEYLQQISGTFFHTSCTCKMGLKNDSMAVVDSDAKVIGVNGLRVVDASAFPFLPPGQPQSAVYMLAEKIADRILDEAWQTVASDGQEPTSSTHEGWSQSSYETDSPVHEDV